MARHQFHNPDKTNQSIEEWAMKRRKTRNSVLDNYRTELEPIEGVNAAENQ